MNNIDNLINSLMCSLLVLVVFASGTTAQTHTSINGRLLFTGSYAPNNTYSLFSGLQYLPRFQLETNIDSTRKVTLLGIPHLSTTGSVAPFDSVAGTANLQAYRAWARYTNAQLEIRAGLQKIDFGSAVLLRPLQWFNQIDPRDPLQLTHGVYAALGRYYFLNNANVWVWLLYGNNHPRGFDLLPSHSKRPEAGFRVQLPVNRGEIALSYHYRTATSTQIVGISPHDKIPENRVAIDGKWDVGTGLWFEAAWIHKAATLGHITQQTWLNVGTDYTINIGSGLHVVAEYMLYAGNSSFKPFRNAVQFTALSVTYPLGFFDNLSWVGLYSFTNQQATFLLNYQHQFKRLTGYVMLFYNPDNGAIGFQQNDFVNQFSGAGIRFMLVFNH